MKTGTRTEPGAAALKITIPETRGGFLPREKIFHQGWIYEVTGKIPLDLPARGSFMPYYSEAESADLRLKIEEIVLEWPGVVKKMLFGSPAYAFGKTYFAMLVTGGIILTRLDDEEKAWLLGDPHAGYFEGHGRKMTKWIHIRILSLSDVDRYLPCLRSSYENARDEKK
ncbi:MAG TPA: hypothetical protein VMC42_04255 [Methanoregulaceae archaeon]|nr:hypothetical protein [Methanoregulaceae archaeon]